MTDEKVCELIFRRYGVRNPDLNLRLQFRKNFTPNADKIGVVKYVAGESDEQKFAQMRHQEELREKRQRISEVMQYVGNTEKEIWPPNKDPRIVKERSLHIKTIKDTFNAKYDEIAMAINNVIGEKTIEGSIIRFIYKNHKK